jgi:hypothetical protein
MLEKNSYLSLVISDNNIWAHLAYTDHNANREYILSDFTDLNPLKQRLDDDFFTKNFWYEYFDNLEKVFNWNIVDRNGYGIFSFRKFTEEGDGIAGIRIQMDENQKYFNKIFSSLRAFSNDIALRVMDEIYMRGMLDGLTQKLGYDDLLFLDLDLQDFKIYRAFKDKQTGKIEISKSKIEWNNEYGVIDSIKDARFKAFLASDVTSKDMLNYWSNFVLNRVVFTEDPNILDMLRAYTTAQLHSIYQDNKDKLQAIGTQGNTGIILTGMVPLLLGKEKLLLSVIDGFEVSGILDAYFDNEKRLLSYAKSYISGPSSSDVVLTRKEVLSCATKVLVPEVKMSRNKSKVIFNGYTDSLEGEKQDIFALSPEFTYIKLPLHRENLIIEGEFKNGAYLRNTEAKDNLSFISIPDKLRYDSMVIDARPKPIVYGPDIYSNKLKLQQWFK